MSNMRPTSRISQSRRGFTLVEILVATALALVLLVGVQQVFKIAGDTVATGFATSGAYRSLRAAQSTFYNDFEGYDFQDSVTGMIPSANQPFIVLHSEGTCAFRDAADQQTDADGNPATDDLSGTGQFPPTTPVPWTDINNRWCRMDVLSFFSQGQFYRQTGQLTGAESFTSSMPVATSAYLWYGHLNQYDNQGSATSWAPGSAANPASPLTSNPNNYYSSQWCLGRVCIPIYSASLNNGYFQVTDGSGNSQVFLASQDAELSPFIFQSTSGDGYFSDGYSNTPNTAYGAVAGPGSSPESSTTAVTQTGMAGGLGGGNPEYYDIAAAPYQAAYGSTSPSAYVGNYCAKVKALETAADTTAGMVSSTNEWWLPLMSTQASFNSPVPFERFAARPFLIGTATPANTSMMAPRFLEGCTNFITEYAGDFLTQDSSGDVTGVVGVSGATAKGFPDFVMDSTSGTAIRRIRWYGLPRNVHGGTKVIGGTGQTGNTANNIVDVVPLRDLLSLAGQGPAPFEKEVPAMAADYSAAALPAAYSSRYTCVWGPQEFDGTAPTVGATTIVKYKPMLIRIIVQVADRNGLLPNGATQEYVFKVP